jgi:hypothetical protein
MSRHISGAYSIQGLSWDEAAYTLRGSSLTVAGDPYTLWFHVPDGVETLRVRASVAGQEVPAKQARDGNSLMIRFDGQQSQVDWEVAFSNKPHR